MYGRVEYSNILSSFMFIYSSFYVWRQCCFNRFVIIFACVACTSSCTHYYNNNISHIAHEFVILMFAISYMSVIVQSKQKYVACCLIAGISSLLACPQYNCLVLFAIALICCCQNPQHVYISSFAKTLMLIATCFWSIDHICCPAIFLPAPFTWHALWHLFIAWTGAVATTDMLSNI